jgi:hypothetical protein
MCFALFKEQQHSWELEFLIVMMLMKLFRFSSRLVWLYVFFSLFSFQLRIWKISSKFFSYEGTVPYWSSAQMPCREETSVSFVAFGILEPQAARHWWRPAVISRHLANVVKRSLLRSAFLGVRPKFIRGNPRCRGLSTEQVVTFLEARVNGTRATWPVHRRSRRF